ncbi:MAG TPA: GGDEF domain-containing protein [Candidatus Ozemobacteraceae bacterium]|nr:GGDEF domain-containing protein [Candidatus Ozemobacteraceae bacterium]
MKESDISNILATAGIFSGLSPESYLPIIREARQVHVGKGECLLDPLSENDSLFILLSGELLVCLDPAPESSVAQIRPGECAGELSIIDDRPPSAYVIGAVPSELIALNRRTLSALVKRLPLIAVNLLPILSDRIRQNNACLRKSLEEQRRFQNKAETDALTKLHNRAWLNEIFPRQLDLGERTGQPVSVGFVDIDHFKKVNDTHGHSVGDLALAHVATCVCRGLRASDMCARYGGEEFAFMLPATDLTQARVIAEQVRRMVAGTPLDLREGETLPLTISIGIGEQKPGETLDALLKRADAALYTAKKEGRNCVRVATS